MPDLEVGDRVQIVGIVDGKPRRRVYSVTKIGKSHLVWITERATSQSHPVIAEALRKVAPSCDGLCIRASEVGNGGDEVVVGHPACKIHGTA